MLDEAARARLRDQLAEARAWAGGGGGLDDTTDLYSVLHGLELVIDALQEALETWAQEGEA